MGDTLATVIKKTAPRPLEAPLLEKLSEVEWDCQALSRHVGSYSKAFLDLARTRRERFAEAALEGFTLPASKDISISALNGRSTVRSATQLADCIGFAIIPWAYLANPFRPTSKVASMIEPWVEEGWPVYVMAPIQAYDLQRHVKAEADLKIFVPSDASQAFLALSMAIPVFRSLQQQIDRLQKSHDDVWERIRSVESEVSNLRSRLSSLEHQVLETRAHQIVKGDPKGLSFDSVFGRLEEVDDPVVLILPKRATLDTADAHVLVGPAWGGDLPAELVRFAKRLR